MHWQLVCWKLAAIQRYNIPALRENMIPFRERFRFARQHFAADAVAGLTGAIAGAPQSMGFALLGGVSPIYGLYASILPTIVGGLLSSSRFTTIAPTNILMLLVAGLSSLSLPGLAPFVSEFMVMAGTYTRYPVAAIISRSKLVRCSIRCAGATASSRRR